MRQKSDAVKFNKDQTHKLKSSNLSIKKNRKKNVEPQINNVLKQLYHKWRWWGFKGGGSGLGKGGLGC